MSSDSDYVCTLDQASIKKAKDELNENPEDRLAAVQALREWIESQPHIKCPQTDTHMLLKFLRGAKFSQVRAREMIEGNLQLKVKGPQWFKDVDSREPNLVALLNRGYIVPLPKRTKDGCQVMLYRMAKLDHKQFSHTALFRIATIILSKMSQSEMTQVNGVVFILDFTGLNSSFMTKMMNSDTQKWQKLWQKNSPGRFKGFNYYNAGVMFDAIMAFARPFMPKKWMDRIRTHDTLETLYKIVPMECFPVEYLPDDYTGPNAGPIDDLIKNFIAEIQEDKFRDQLLYTTSDAFGVDESKKPTEQVTQHFRKLNVD